MAELHVVPRRLVGLEDIIIGAEIGSDPHLIAELGLEIGQLLGRHIVVHIKFASLEAFHRGGAVFGRNVIHDVDLHIGGVVEFVGSSRS